MKVPIMYHVYIQSVFLCFGNDVRSIYMSNYDIGVSVMIIINICQFYNIRHKHNYHQMSSPRNNCRERVKLVYFATQVVGITNRQSAVTSHVYEFVKFHIFVSATLFAASVQSCIVVHGSNLHSFIFLFSFILEYSR